LIVEILDVGKGKEWRGGGADHDPSPQQFWSAARSGEPTLYPGEFRGRAPRMAGPCVAVQHASWDLDFGRSELPVHLCPRWSDDGQSRGPGYRGQSFPGRVAG